MLKTQIEIWLRLPLSLAGRVSILKMVVLPKCLYLFNNIPIPLTNSFFRMLCNLLTCLVWGGKQARVQWSVLTLPYDIGGYSVSDLQLYYVVAQCSYAHSWFHPDTRIPYLRPEADLVLPERLSYLRASPEIPTTSNYPPQAGHGISYAGTWVRIHCTLRHYPSLTPIGYQSRVNAW